MGIPDDVAADELPHSAIQETRDGGGFAGDLDGEGRQMSGKSTASHDSAGPSIVV